MKRILLLTIVIVLLVTIIAAVFVTSTLYSTQKHEFYVGVTYCGSSADEAKQLIDKVRGYTNLFVLDSGPLQYKPEVINEIGDYAVNAGLHYIIYFGADSSQAVQYWNKTYDGRWNSSFLGIYFGDESGGKMLDSERQLYDPVLGSVMKYANGNVQWNIGNDSEPCQVTYSKDGTISLRETQYDHISDIVTQTKYSNIVYYPNGTITRTIQVMTQNLTQVTRLGSPSFQVTSTVSTSPVTTVVTDDSTLDYTYNELWNLRPIQTYDQAEQWYVAGTNLSLNRYHLQNVTYLTSDYALYWYDYLAGYDTVLAQLGWNHTTAQDIGMVRGAAALQNKSWGTIITWKYTQAPYLANGQEIYDQMRQSYECGAKYVILFNYAENMTGSDGTLREEHFQALQRFWNDVVKSPFVSQGSVKAEAAFVLPHNYGWRMRNQQDTVWGLWQPPEEYQQIWPKLQDALVKYGDKLDIVYEDAVYPVANYPQVIYWNQTG